MATQTGVVGKISERYATALYELADEAHALDDVAGDLTTLRSLIAESGDLRTVLRSPLIDRDSKAAAINAILEATGAGDLTRRFIGIVARNSRLFALSGMIEAFLAELSRRRGEVTAEVTSAQALQPAQLESITNTLRDALGGTVSVDATVDPSLIGGLIVRVGSRMIDASLKMKLQRLQFAMKGAQ